MWRGDISAQRNPMELVKIKGATKRTRKPRSLTVEEFQRFIQHLEEPIRTIALVCVCFGLRISECLALKWSDVDWLNCKLRVERGIVRQTVDKVKTVYSERPMAIDKEMLEALKAWKQTTESRATMTGFLPAHRSSVVCLFPIRGCGACSKKLLLHPA